MSKVGGNKIQSFVKAECFAQTMYIEAVKTHQNIATLWFRPSV